MTTTGIQLQGSTRRVPLATAGAVALALLVGATVGSIATNVIVRDATVPTVPVMWDAQKMDAMQARLSFVATPAPAIGYDAAKLEALEGRLRFTGGAPTIAWDAQKLEAMAGRQLAG